MGRPDHQRLVKFEKARATIIRENGKKKILRKINGTRTSKVIATAITRIINE